MSETWVGMRSMVRSRPSSRKRCSPVASNWSNAEPYWKPWVHSVHPREAYLPLIVKTGVPLWGAHILSMFRIFSAESSNKRTSLGSSFCAVSRKSILMAMDGVD